MKSTVTFTLYTLYTGFPMAPSPPPHLRSFCGENIILRNKVAKVTHAFWLCRRVVGAGWCLKQAMVEWLYSDIVRLSLTFVVFVWWLATEEEWTKRILGKIQRLSCMTVACSFRNPPTAALEVMLNLLVASSDFVSSGRGWSYCCGIDSTRD